jgi:hypothetical protein
LQQAWLQSVARDESGALLDCTMQNISDVSEQLPLRERSSNISSAQHLHSAQHDGQSSLPSLDSRIKRSKARELKVVLPSLHSPQAHEVSTHIASSVQLPPDAAAGSPSRDSESGSASGRVVELLEELQQHCKWNVYEVLQGVQ